MIKWFGKDGRVAYQLRDAIEEVQDPRWLAFTPPSILISFKLLRLHFEKKSELIRAGGKEIEECAKW